MFCQCRNPLRMCQMITVIRLSTSPSLMFSRIYSCSQFSLSLSPSPPPTQPLSNYPQTFSADASPLDTGVWIFFIIRMFFFGGKLIFMEVEVKSFYEAPLECQLTWDQHQHNQLHRSCAKATRRVIHKCSTEREAAEKDVTASVSSSQGARHGWKCGRTTFEMFIHVLLLASPALVQLHSDPCPK